MRHDAVTQYLPQSPPGLLEMVASRHESPGGQTSVRVESASASNPKTEENSMTKTVLRPCIVCGQACAAGERNSDGTYAHTACLRSHQVRPGS